MAAADEDGFVVVIEITGPTPASSYVLLACPMCGAIVVGETKPMHIKWHQE